MINILKLAVCAAILAPGAAPATVNTIQETSGIDSSGRAEFDKFDTSNGSLIAVLISINGRLDSSSSITNFDASTTVFGVGIDSSFKITTLDGEINGISHGGGAGGLLPPGTGLYSTPAHVGYNISGANLAAYLSTSAGDDPFVQLEISSLSLGSIFGPISVTLFPGTTYSGQATITYTYNVVPEPAAWSMMVAGFGIAGLGLRAGGERRRQPDRARPEIADFSRLHPLVKTQHHRDPMLLSHQGSLGRFAQQSEETLFSQSHPRMAHPLRTPPRHQRAFHAPKIGGLLATRPESIDILARTGERPGARPGIPGSSLGIHRRWRRRKRRHRRRGECGRRRKRSGCASPARTSWSRRSAAKQRLQDVPTAVTVLGRICSARAGSAVPQTRVLNLVPNASAGTQQHGRPRWWIRGVGAGQQQLDLANPVGFYLDDVYISNASATGLPLFDIERVEVLPRTAGHALGKNTTGGAINVISKRPSLSPGNDDNYAKLEYGSFDNKIAEAGIGTVLVPDVLAVRVSGRFDDRDGRFTNLFTGDKSSAVRDAVLRGQLLFKPSDELEALLSVHYRDYDTDGTYWTTISYAPNGVLRNGYAPPTDKDDINTNAGEFSRNKQIGGSLHLDATLGELTLTSITGYERFKTRGATDGDYTPLEISRGYTAARSRQWTQELRLASPQTDRLNWILGALLFQRDDRLRTPIRPPCRRARCRHWPAPPPSPPTA